MVNQCVSAGAAGGPRRRTSPHGRAPVLGDLRVFSVRQHSAHRRWVASQLIVDHNARFIADAANKLPQEAFGRADRAVTAPRCPPRRLLIDCSPLARIWRQSPTKPSAVARSCSPAALIATPSGRGQNTRAYGLADSLEAFEEGAQSLRLGIAEHHGRVTFLDNLAGVNEHDTIGHLLSE